jgi:hypothetical protein
VKDLGLQVPYCPGNCIGGVVGGREKTTKSRKKSGRWPPAALNYLATEDKDPESLLAPTTLLL